MKSLAAYYKHWTRNQMFIKSCFYSVKLTAYLWEHDISVQRDLFHLSFWMLNGIISQKILFEEMKSAHQKITKNSMLIFIQTTNLISMNISLHDGYLFDEVSVVPTDKNIPLFNTYYN